MMKLPVALVVSDDPAKLTLLKKTLKDLFKVVEKNEIKTALEFLNTSSVDLVILDARIREGHSVETAEELRAAVFLETPILLITHNIKKSFSQVALRSGITDFINEPLNKDEILQRIAVAFKTQDRSKKISQIAQRKTPRMKSSVPLSNYEFLNDQAIKEIAKARKTSTILSLLMIELDDFHELPPSKSPKAHSHLEKVLQKNLRKNDLLIPQGPGKFILMLPRTSKRAAEMIAESIRTEVLNAESKMPLSVSIGLISLDQATPGSADEIFDRLLSNVTRAASEAKKTGNKIVST